MCLSFDEIQQLEIVCQEYLKMARNNKQCSPMINIRQIFEERAERKRAFFKRVSERSRENLEHWKNEQRELALNVATEKRKRLDKLMDHLNDVKQRKVNERKVNVELELQHLKYLQQLEMQSYQVENINLRKRIEYYQELCESIQDERRQEHLKQIHQKDFHCLSAKPKLISDKNVLTTQTQSINTRLNTDGTIVADIYKGDGRSEYEECLPGDFVEKFAKTADMLEQIMVTKELNNNQCEGLNDNIGESNHLKEEENLNETTTTTLLKRSISDVLNSNELPETVLETPSTTLSNFYSTLNENRRKNLTGSAVSECLQEQFKQKLKTDIKSTKNEDQNDSCETTGNIFNIFFLLNFLLLKFYSIF